MTEDLAENQRQKLDADNREQAKHAWSNIDAAVANSTEQTVSFGLSAIRAAGVANAAGLAAFLGFISANATRLNGLIADLDAIPEAFVIGIFLAAIASGGAYWSQMLYTLGLNDHEKSINPPWVVSRFSGHTKAGDAVRMLTIVCIILAYLTFITGSLRLVSLIKHAVTAA